MAKLVRQLGAAAGKVTGLDVVGGKVPLSVEEFGLRAYLQAMNPLYNPLKDVFSAFKGDITKTPPMLGIFSDIPWNQLRESEVHAWAKAGFSWVVCDGEHSQSEGRYGREQFSMMLRLGITPIQRLHREARSEHGDALTLGARATMAPYTTTVEEAAVYYQCVNYPDPAVRKASPNDRGGFPMRKGDRELLFTPDSLRQGEQNTQGWIQFETAESISDEKTRDAILDVMQQQGSGKAVGFVGPFDAVLRTGNTQTMEADIKKLFKAATDRGVYMGRVCGSGAVSSPSQIEDAMADAIESGCRLIAVHYLTSDLTYVGASAASAPFWKAATRCGF
eukprot:m.29105 g.29105  ORF g.29105 m.29105 type:complete len:334 (+) comp16040_c0_seq1:221-1222(+)